MDAMVRCYCTHLYWQHKARLVPQAGGVVLACSKCEACRGFEEAVEELVSFTGVAEPAGPLLGAWRSWWCPTCGSTTWLAGAVCCGEPALPVRLEMHSWEPL